MDPIIVKGLVGFMIPVVLGMCSYSLATLVAHIISRTQRQIYFYRLVYLILFLVLCCFVYPPAETFSGSGERYARALRSGYGVQTMAASYGMQTYWVWLAIAGLKRLKKANDNKTAFYDGSSVKL